MFYWIIRNLIWCILKVIYRFKITGRENIPRDTNFIACANHGSNLDPLLVGVSLPLNIGFMAKEELFRNKLFGFILKAIGAFPIKRGSRDAGAVRAALHLLGNGRSMVMFPEGRRSKNEKLSKGKTGAVSIAIKSNVPIVPIGVVGKYKPFEKMKVHIGKPIDLSQYYNTKLTQEKYQQITDEVLMNTIASLAGVEYDGGAVS